jgi:hypothetical protein
MRTVVATVVLSLALSGGPSVAGAATELKRYTAWDPNGDPVVNAFSDATGDCTTESCKSSRSDAWRCFAGSQILDPCFENPLFEREVLCVPSPWARGRGGRPHPARRGKPWQTSGRAAMGSSAR